MKLTNSQIIQYLTQLKQVSQCRGKLGWAVYRNIKVLSEALDEYNKMHDDLVRKYSSNGQTVDKEKFDEFSKELQPLLEIEQDLEIRMISESEMYDDDLTAQDYLKLDFLVADKALN